MDMSKETEERRTRRGRVAAVVGLLLLTGSVIVTGGRPAAAQGDLAVLEGTMDVGELISFDWDGEADIEGGTLTANGWDAVGGWFPDVNVTADVDTIVSGTHVVLSSYAITVVGTTCTITIHGPLLIDHTTGTTYYAHFDAIDLGTVLYSMGCGSGPSSIRNLFETAFTADGLLLQFEIDHVEPEPLYLIAGVIDFGFISWQLDEPVEVEDDHVGPMEWIIIGGDPSMPLVEILAHVDAFTAGTSLQLLLVAMDFVGTGCTMTWHGPLQIDHIEDGIFHAYFDELELGGILYSSECTASGVGDLWLYIIASNGVLLTLYIAHL
jgi:hypothetical protein